MAVPPPTPTPQPPGVPESSLGRTLELADATVDTGQQLLVRGERVVHLTTLENAVLVHLWDHAGRTVTREELLEAVWGHPRHASTEPVYSTIKRLRAKIEGPGAHRHIVTVHGDGYRFERPPARGVPVSGAPGPATTAREATSRASGPPAARTRFVGRERELVAIEQRLGEGARLVTLVGPGGVGKTRLARELARRRAERGEASVFVDLAEALTLEDALRAMATALDVRLEGADPRRGLLRALTAMSQGPEAPLVILDNVEQLVGALAPVVARWCDAAPLMATSRERFAISGEHVIQLEPLSPDEAVALFVDRARMVSAGFDAQAELEHIRSIVERLDRLPLAIELAAARVRLWPPEALLGRLDDQLDRLGRAPRDMPVRHASLREAIEWSWRLLHEDERATLARCAIFAGGFTLEAAEAVLPGDESGSLIERLCDRSLVRVRPDPSGARFELYAAVQQLAAEKLAACEDRAELAARHAEWVLDEGARWVADLDGRGHARARARLEVELDNLRAALARELEAGGERAGALAWVVDRCLRLRGGAALRRSMLTEALAAVHGDRARAPLALALGECLGELGEPAAIGWLDEAAASAERAELVEVQALAEAARAELFASRGELSNALEGFERARVRAATHGARGIAGRVATAAGEVLWRAGRATEAQTALEEALAIHREVGDLRHLARTQATLCHVLRAAGRPAQAMVALEEAARGFEALGDPLGRARTAIDRGLHLSRVGRQREAVVALEEARAGFERLGVLRGREEVQLNLAEALLGLGDDARALDELHLAVAICRELDERLRLSTALELLACAAVLRDDIVAAEGALEEALAIAEASGNQRSRATILAKRGLCSYLRGRYAQALADFEASARINHARGESAMEGTSRADVAVALAAAGGDADTRTAALTELATARTLLGEPGGAARQSTWITRMLDLLEAATAVHLARAAGEDEELIRSRALAIRAEVLAHMPPEAQDLATRLSCAMLDHALRAGGAI